MKTYSPLMLLLAGLLLAVPAGAAGPRIDLPVAFRLDGKPQDAEATLYLKSELFYAKQADAPSAQWELLGSDEHPVSRTGAPTQLFAAWVTADRPITQQMLDGAIYIRHTLSLRKPSGGMMQVLWSVVSGNQRVGRVPFASHAEVADRSCANGFEAVSKKATVSAERMSVTTVQGLSSGAVTSLTAESLDSIGSIELKPELAEKGSGDRPAMSVPTLTVDGSLTFGTADVELPETGSSGKGLVPPGTVIAWARTDRSPGPGWALCNGTSLWLNGRTVTLPNMDGRFPVGTLPAGTRDAQGRSAAYALTETGGRDSVTLSAYEMPPHRHDFSGFLAPGRKNYHFHSVALHDDGSVWRGSTVSRRDESGKSGANVPHENRPPFSTVRFYIKLP